MTGNFLHKTDQFTGLRSSSARSVKVANRTVRSARCSIAIASSGNWQLIWKAKMAGHDILFALTIHIRFGDVPTS